MTKFATSFFFLAVLCLPAVGQTKRPKPCTTDTDCVRKNGGDPRYVLDSAEQAKARAARKARRAKR